MKKPKMPMPRAEIMYAPCAGTYPEGGVLR